MSAKATEWTRRSSSPPKASATWAKVCSSPSSERTSHSQTSGLPTDSARSRTPFFDPLALVGERELRAAGREPLRDRPGDRAPVGDAEDETALAVEGSGHEGAVYSGASNEGFARWALDASCR